MCPGSSEDDKLEATMLKLPSGYSSQLESLERVFGPWGKLLRIVQCHLKLDKVIVVSVELIEGLTDILMTLVCV